MAAQESTSQLTMEFASALLREGVRRSRRRGPVPRFKPDTTRQLDAVRGTPSLQVPQDHLAWKLLRFMDALDTGVLESKYSSLGRRGFHPKRLLAVWTYASAIGVHSASRVELLLQTDAAFRLLSGGHAVSAETLRRFRREFKDIAPALMGQLLERAVAGKLVRPEDLAADSMRLEADASMDQVRRAEHSERRLAALDKVDVSSLTPEELERHEKLLKRHREAVAVCEAQGRTNVVLTCDTASLMKFPHGSSKPGHRVSAVVSGARARYIVALLIDAASSDYGKIEPLMKATREALTTAGVGEGVRLQVAADAGYFSGEDLAWAAENRSTVDVLIKEPPPKRAQKENEPGKLKFFGRDDFKVDPETLIAVCPAGRQMKGPYQDGSAIKFWRGSGCSGCSLKAKCTEGGRRKLSVRFGYEKLVEEMRDRMSQPDATARYGQRVATVEPAFAYIEDVMSFRRLSSRHAGTIVSEIHLKVFAYNLLRLLSCARSFWVFLELTRTPDGVSVRLWAPPDGS